MKTLAKGEMSNFDHQISGGLEEELRGDPECYAEYPGWNFHGTVSFKDGEFVCEVMQYHTHVATIKAPTLQEIMDETSERYGYD